MHDLNPAKLATLPPGWHNDGGNLALAVDDKGYRAWVVKVTVKGSGVRRTCGIGGLQEVSLKEARIKAAKIVADARNGIDPKVQRHQAAEAAKASTAPTFGVFADERLPTFTKGHKSQKTVEKWLRDLQVHAAPIRDLPIDTITTEDVLKMLEPHYARAPAMARELRGRVEKVFSAAISLKRRPRELGNPAALRDNLEHLIQKLPPRGKLKGAQPSMPYRQLPAFIPVLRQSEGLVAKALLLVILTALRTNEARELLWSEIDLDAAVIRLDKRRMKNAIDAEIPLSPPAVELLRQLQHDAISTYVFPGRKSGEPISSDAMLKYLKTGKAKRPDCTVHGFRSSFRSWGQDLASHSRETLEFCLHHIEGSEAERAYKAGAMLEKRRAALADWATYIMSPPKPALRVVA